MLRPGLLSLGQLGLATVVDEVPGGTATPTIESVPSAGLAYNLEACTPPP